MCKFIGIECLAGNALIELFERQDIKEVSFDMLVQYGMKVVHILEAQTNEEIILLLSKQYQLNMIENCSDYFSVIFSPDGKGVISLKDDFSDRERILEELKERFRWTMSTKYINAFVSEGALQELGIVA